MTNYKLEQIAHSVWLSANQEAEVIGILERHRGTACYSVQGVIGYVERNGDFIRQTLSQAMQQGSTAGEPYSMLHDIGIQLRGGGLERL